MMIDQRFYAEEILPGGKVRLTRQGHSAVYPISGLKRYADGEFIEIALPDVKPCDREFIVSGMLPDEWRAMFIDVDDVL